MLTGTGASTWFVDQLSQPTSTVLPQVMRYLDEDTAFSFAEFPADTTTFAYWRNVLTGPDQLRQRVAYALSQILVVSNGGGEFLTDVPTAVAYYMDVLSSGALGNYRDLLEQVTYTPAMGHYLTYQGNQKGDPVTGRVPDENYAREILQLFTIGTVMLNPDGTPSLDASGGAIETYSNADVTGLAKVFTGLNFSEEDTESASLYEVTARPMQIFEEDHSALEKTFLGSTIAANTPTASSISQALDIIFAHPNVAPFIGRQLIQRLVTSHPDPEYIDRVSAAFESGRYTLPDGTLVGDGRRGDLAATVAAVLFDPLALSTDSTDTFGKIREPVLRFSNWVRAFDVAQIDAEYVLALWDTTDALGQHPYRARSVFNFYRPGYIAPGTSTGALGLTIPELQIVNAASIPAYVDFMTYIISRDPQEEVEELVAEFSEIGLNIDTVNALNSFVPNYQRELSLADKPEQLLDLLDEKLTYGRLSDTTRANIVEVLNGMPVDDEGLIDRVHFAILMVVTSIDFLLQQ